MEQIKLLSTTALLSMLIWWGADQLVNETVTVDVTLDPVPPSANPMMEVSTRPGVGRVELEVFGPRNLVADLSGKPLQAHWTVPDLPTGTSEVNIDRQDLKKALEVQWPEFRRLSIVRVQPQTVTVVIDHWITRAINLTANRTAMAYDVMPQLQQTATTVRMRESVARERPALLQGSWDISSDIENVLRELPPGVPVTVPISLDVHRFGNQASATPSTVEVTATVQAQRKTAQIPTVPILLAVSFANLERPIRPVSRDGTPLPLMTQNITVTGFREAVDRLVNNETRAYGTIHVKQADFETLDVPMLVTPEYHLPDGIELAKTPPPIEFKLVRIGPSD